jgi:1,4-alpha-glucan branching enzyme
MGGIFSLMLHSHIPYCRKSGVWPAGEEWLFEAMTETYIPLLSILRLFQLQNLSPRITIGIVPILAEQLADPYMNDRFREYIENKIDRAQKDCERFQSDPKKYRVAQFHQKELSEVYRTYREEFHHNILGSFKWLQDENTVELITSAATHGFLPLLEQDSSIYAQVRLGIETFEKYFGVKPKGMWLPECAYRPREWSERENRQRRSIDEWLADEKIQYFFTEDIGILRSEILKSPLGEKTPNTYHGYKLESGVTVFGRNSATGKQVWSPDGGYPGDPYFREFHIKDPQSGLHYHRVTGALEKDIYIPRKAQEHLNLQADHFVGLLSKLAQDQTKNLDDMPPIIVSPYDSELYGHWWMEGVDWLEAVYTRLLKPGQTLITPLSPSEYIAQYGDTFSTIRMHPSTWGENGDFTVWLNKDHGWIWPYINGASREMEMVLENIDSNQIFVQSKQHRILKQLGRELLLMQGSDWPFLLYTEQAKAYANKRFHNHHQRFNKLLWASKNLAESGRISDGELSQMEDIDNPWSDLDYNIFRKRS